MEIPIQERMLFITRTTRTPAFWGYPPPRHDYSYHWVILDPKSKEDKVKVTNLKNSPKFQIFEFWNGHYTRHTFWSCLIRCANMKWIRWVFLKIQSRHDSVNRRTDGQTDKVIPVYPPFNFVEAGGIMKWAPWIPVQTRNYPGSDISKGFLLAQITKSNLFQNRSYWWVSARKGQNSSVLAMELHLSCMNTSIYYIYIFFFTTTIRFICPGPCGNEICQVLLPRVCVSPRGMSALHMLHHIPLLCEPLGTDGTLVPLHLHVDVMDVAAHVVWPRERLVTQRTKQTSRNIALKRHSQTDYTWTPRGSITTLFHEK